MTVVVTRNVSGRMRGFLASTMLEISPGVYSGPRITVAVRERIWSTIVDWFDSEAGASIVMLWLDKQVPCGQQIRHLGLPPIEFVAIDGIVLAKTRTTG